MEYPKIKDAIDNLKIRRFANPTAYEGANCENRIEIIKRSDHRVFEHYARVRRGIKSPDWDVAPDGCETPIDFVCFSMGVSKEDAEDWYAQTQKLTELERSMVYVYADAYHLIVVPDKTFSDIDLLAEFMDEEHNIILGPEVDRSGKYLNFDGGESKRLDFRGNIVKLVNWRYVPNNSIWMGGGYVLSRCVFISNEDHGLYESVIFFKSKDKGRIYSLDEYEQSHYIDNSGELLPNVILVKDLDDQPCLIRNIIGYITENCSGYSGKYDIHEETLFSVKYENPIKFVYTLD